MVKGSEVYNNLFAHGEIHISLTYICDHGP